MHASIKRTRIISRGEGGEDAVRRQNLVGDSLKISPVIPVIFDVILDVREVLSTFRSHVMDQQFSIRLFKTTIFSYDKIILSFVHIKRFSFAPAIH